MRVEDIRVPGHAGELRRAPAGRGYRCLRRIAYRAGSPVPDSTSLPAAVVADTIVRTVELGVTITDAAVDGEVTVVVFCNLLGNGKKDCPGVRHTGCLPRHRDPHSARCSCGRASAAAACAGAALPLHGSQL